MGCADVAELSPAQDRDEEGHRDRGQGKVFTAEIKMEREGRRPPISTFRCSRSATGDGTILYLLFEARDITELKAAQEQLRQSQKMEALGAADRRHRPRLQQSADRGRRRPGHHHQARRRAEAQALCRECAGRRRTRSAADRTTARVQPGPTARGAADLCRAADREHAAAAAQRARPRDHQAVRPRQGDDAGDGRPDPARSRGAEPRDQRPRRHARRRRADLLAAPGAGRPARPTSRPAIISS